MKLSSNHLTKYNAQRLANARGAVCWSAETSMYLGFRGNITTCCFNKTYIIGKYPEKTLCDIWFGEKRKKLHLKLTQGDFSSGCHGCKELIEAGNFRALPAKNFDHFERDKFGYPTKIDFELSNECNLECIMCRGEFSSAIRKNRESLPPILSPYDNDFVKQLEEFIPYVKTCHFLGGEPFMVPIYLTIWKKIAEINPNVLISVQTNATILSDRIKHLLEAVRFDISVSIDSMRKENYEFIRKNGNFEKVMVNISYFRDYTHRKGTKLNFSVCPMPQNWQELPAFVDFSNDHDATLFFNMVHYPKECSFRFLDRDQLDLITNELRKPKFPEQTENQRLNALAYRQMVEHISSSETPHFSQEKNADFSLFLTGLDNFIQKQNDLESNAVSLDEIESKLEYILKIAEQKNKRKEAEQKIMEVSYRDLYDAVPGVDKEHLLHLFRSFMLPIPEGD